MSTFTGVITAMVTPFSENGEVDLPGCRSVARHLIENGSSGLVLAGTTGESPTLEDSEKLAVLAAVREELGSGTQLIVGTGSNDTRHSVELTRAATDAGADAVLIVTPYYSRPNALGVRAHFETVAAATELPVIAYNIPSRCVVNISPGELAALAMIENVVAVKQANNDELGPIEGMEVLAGNDESFLRALQSGGTGGILVASHLVGPQMAQIYDAVQSGDEERAAEIDTDLQPLYAALGVTTNPIPIKTALSMLGICSDRMRLPMVPATAPERACVRAELDRLGIAAGA